MRCANCGKTGLSRVVAVKDGARVMRVGSECAKRFSRATFKDMVHAVMRGREHGGGAQRPEEPRYTPVPPARRSLAWLQQRDEEIALDELARAFREMEEDERQREAQRQEALRHTPVPPARRIPAQRSLWARLFG